MWDPTGLGMLAWQYNYRAYYALWSVGTEIAVRAMFYPYLEPQTRK